MLRMSPLGKSNAVNEEEKPLPALLPSFGLGHTWWPITWCDQPLTYIDKTQYLMKIIDDMIDTPGSLKFFLAPECTGKTLFLTTVLRYLDERKKSKKEAKTFDGLHISREGLQRHFTAANKYPVIWINLGLCVEKSEKDAWESLLGLVDTMYSNVKEAYPHLKNYSKIFNDDAAYELTEKDLGEVLPMLLKAICSDPNYKPVIIINDYDEIIESAYLNGFSQKIINLLKLFLAPIFEDKAPQKKDFSICLLGGKYNFVAELVGKKKVKDLHVYDIHNEEYGGCFGFTEEEMQEMVVKYSLLEGHFNKLKDWCGNYRVGRKILFNFGNIISILPSLYSLERRLKPDLPENERLKQLREQLSTILDFPIDNRVGLFSQAEKILKGVNSILTKDQRAILTGIFTCLLKKEEVHIAEVIINPVVTTLQNVERFFSTSPHKLTLTSALFPQNFNLFEYLVCLGLLSMSRATTKTECKLPNNVTFSKFRRLCSSIFNLEMRENINIHSSKPL